ncbi:MAG: efflux RND transporter periplasmic adaptor subunit [Porphyromonadaceae bacterium]|nr:efflux RND transporter periplasmic adaptor subunit [Porphyromonadaceae bacterium]
MNKFLLCLFSSFLMGVLLACSSSSDKLVSNENISITLPEISNEVCVMPLKKQVFHQELVSNGKVSAVAYADLYFLSNERVAHIYVQNGDRVCRGQKLAELELFSLQNELSQATNNLEKARLDLKDVLIGQGYSLDSLASIPDGVMHIALIRSGYAQCEDVYKKSKYALDCAVLVAPYDGVVANLFHKENNLSEGGKAFCRVISTDSMEVDFTLIENELFTVRCGDAVKITPYAIHSKEYTGYISMINPVVESDGMVHAKAYINNVSPSLYEGMNVRVRIQQEFEHELVVPKTAVVLRSGRQVVFTLENGKAIWNYVRTGMENLTEYTIEEGLEEGAMVIISGNVNLAHESPVVVINNSDL